MLSHRIHWGLACPEPNLLDSVIIINIFQNNANSYVKFLPCCPFVNRGRKVAKPHPFINPKPKKSLSGGIYLIFLDGLLFSGHRGASFRSRYNFGITVFQYSKCKISSGYSILSVHIFNSFSWCIE